VAVTLKDVADAAGVSTATASRVLSGRRPVTADVAAVVRAASEQLGYQTDVVARSLRMRTTGTVGMVVPRISNPFFPAVVEAVEQELAQGDVQLLLCDSRGSLEQEAARIRALIGRRVDGILLVPCESPGSDEVVATASAAVPVVLIDRTAGPTGTAAADFVCTDDRLGMALLFELLLARGARTFAWVSATGTTSSAVARTESYRAHAGAVDAASAERTLLGDFSYEWGHEVAGRLLAAGPLPDAVVCGADIVALGLLSTFHVAGVAVPGDVLVTGYDDIGFAALSNPALTTVRQPVEQLGRAAVGLLRARMADRSAPRQLEMIKPTLVVRESTGY